MVFFDTPEFNTSFGKFAFSNCVSFGSLYIPKATTFIDNYAFHACEGLEKIWVNCADPAKIGLGLNVFLGLNIKKCHIFIPPGSLKAYQEAPQWNLLVNYEYQPAPGASKAPASAHNVPYNLHEFDFDAYFLAHPKFESATAYAFFLSGTPVQNESPVKVYPAITRENIRVSGITGTTMIEICDVRGSVVYRQNLDADADISLASLPQAVYLVRITPAAGNTGVYRIVKN